MKEKKEGEERIEESEMYFKIAVNINLEVKSDSISKNKVRFCQLERGKLLRRKENNCVFLPSEIFTKDLRIAPYPSNPKIEDLFRENRK